MSNIKIYGNIGKEPELRYTPEAKPVLSWSVALYTGKDPAGQALPAVWARCYAFGENAEKWAKTLHKGGRVTVTGSVKAPREWKDKEGVMHPAGLEVTAWEVVEGNEFAPQPEPVGEW